MLVNQKGSYRHSEDQLNIPAKANRVLNVVLVGMLLIVLRIWHLAVVQYDEKVEESRKPQRRIVVESAKRATIRDRFNIPLAINKVQYNVAVLYSQLKQIPTAAWETDSSGKRKKVFRRKEYIAALSQLLGKELKMDADRIEDLIHSKASFYHQIPFVLKEDVSELEYYRLKMLEREWLGINVQRTPRRHYPLGKVAGDIIGYMGAINRQEYEKVIREIKALEAYVETIDLGEFVSLPPGMDSSNQVRKRIKDLNALAYTINDSVGKAGIEGRYESTLRGYHGKKIFYSDARGNFFRELPGAREPLSGKRLLLTISAELQEFAEQLLIQNERIRLTRLSHLDAVKQTVLALKQPWIKGGAIIVMEPHSGDLLAMASIPRVDPNDFVSSKNPANKLKKSNIHKWFENEVYLAEVWNQQRLLDREIFDEHLGGFYDEGIVLKWQNYLDLVLEAENPLKKGVLSTGTLKDAIYIQKLVDRLLELTPYKNIYSVFNLIYTGEEHQSYAQKNSSADLEVLENAFTLHFQEVLSIKRKLDVYMQAIKNNYDKVLLLDMLRMLVEADLFSDELVKNVGKQTLSTYKDASSAMVATEEVVKKMAKSIYHETDFKGWRKEKEKEYLKGKRAEEKATKKYAKPYIDYLDALENEMFASFWEKQRWHLITTFLRGDVQSNMESCPSAYIDHMCSWQREIQSGAHREIEWSNAYFTLQEAIKNIPTESIIPYLKTLRSFQDLNRPLLGKYRYLRKNNEQLQLEKHLAAAFYHKFGCGYGRSQAYRQASTQGSIFKLVTAYEALVQRYHKLEEAGKDTSDLNPLEIVDMIFHHGKDQYVGYNADGQPLPRFYKGGRLPRSTHSIGKVDLMKAIETSSNPYFAVLAGDVLDSPQDLAKAAKQFSFGERTGIDLPGEIPGKVPDDLDENRTGLYSLSIGQHTLVVTPLQTTVMLAALANGGAIVKPKIVGALAGREPLRGKDLMSDSSYYPHQQALSLIGIDFPLFTAADAEQQKSLIKYVPSEVKRTLFMPKAVQKMLLDSMCRVVVRSQNDTLISLSRLYSNHPEAISDYVELKNQLVGKTSTAESIENIDLDLTKGTNIYTHVWFGGIAYDHDIIEKKGPQGTYLFLSSFGTPEVVVVVYLRYGGYGKEAAPIAAQMVKKWREIKQKYSKE
ncbi:MAG: hypothetical protein H0X29_02510 [Parachlamydiaceae bacterium]|nr:hypothetical protein [Parachlamydiaceae bacterium]